MIPTVINQNVELSLNGISTAEIRSELDLVLRSRVFLQSHRIRRFLQFIVLESLLGQPQRLKEYLIGMEVFDRREAFDPRVDSIVRVEARRLRYKLDEYYRTEGREDLVRIILRKGSYVPAFEYRTTGSDTPDALGRRTVEMAPFSLTNAAPDSSVSADEIQRRLAHVLIKEGCFQVIAKFQPDPWAGGSGAEAHATSTGQADYAVDGSLEFHPGGFHLILQLRQSADGSYFWSEAIDGRFEDLRRVDQLGQSLVRELTALPKELLLARRQAVGQESRDLYLQGRYHWKLATPESIRNSVSCFSRAVANDESYAAAWAALAEALLVSSMFGLLAPQDAASRIRHAALRAAALNPVLPEAHVALGSALSLLDWNWTAGEEELQKSIQLDRHDSVGLIAYGIQLACRGNLDGAVSQVERALEVDPASLFPNFVLGWLYGVCRRYDQAIATHSLVARFAPDYGLAHLGLGLAYAGQGEFADAVAHFTNASQLKCSSLIHGQIGYCYARCGREEEALKEIAVLTSRSDARFLSPLSLATIYAGLGDRAKALDHLERAVEVRDTSLPVHLLGAEFDILRDEDRFQALRQRIGLLACDQVASGG
jgi:tetratricopeptide (TPR) repeat protein